MRASTFSGSESTALVNSKGWELPNPQVSQPEFMAALASLGSI